MNRIDPFENTLALEHVRSIMESIQEAFAAGYASGVQGSPIFTAWEERGQPIIESWKEQMRQHSLRLVNHAGVRSES